MDPLIIVALMAVGIGAGIIGAIFGLGGGIIFMPFLTIAFGLGAIEATAISLIGIVASSVGAASIYVRRGMSNVRLGLLMEITTTIGAVVGAFIAAYLSNWMLLCIFSAVLIYSSLHMMFHGERISEPPDVEDNMSFTYYDENEGLDKRYEVENVRGGLALCTVAGAVSSMTGVGGGAIKVPLMNLFMHVPIKVASATSSYMIGITAFSGAIIYFLNGFVLLDYAAGMAIGAYIGSLIGTKISRNLKSASMRKYLAIVLIVIAILELSKAGGLI